MIPVPIRPVIYAPGAGGAPSTATQLPDLTGALSSYQHTIAAAGGFESLSLEVGLSLDEALDWLRNLGASIVCYGPDAEIVWEGMLTSVGLGVGEEQIDLGLDDMANAVRVRYQPGIGAQTSTAFATNAESIATYGRKELIYGGSGMTQAAAEALRDALLDARAYPLPRRSGGASTGKNGREVRLTMGGTGWYYTTDWLTTSSTTTATAVTTTQLQTLITAYNVTNAFFSTSYGDIVASGLSDTQYIDPDTPYRQKIERLLSIGNSSGQRLAWGVYEDRQWRVNQWAGAAPSTITYTRSLGDGRITTPGGGVVEPWDVRPDAMYQVAELIDPSLPATVVDTVSRYYVERVTCTINQSGTSVRMEPAKSGELDVLLARIRG